ncbi:MAG TPA: glycosyltransferase family 39 protein [Waterburya sp.]
MKSQLTLNWGVSTNGLKVLIVVLLVIGIFFRFFNLDYKVYWHDEVYTSMRAAGFTRAEIDQELFQNQIVPAQELQKFQHLKPGSTLVDTIKSLALEDPQHPPFYFLIARFWMQVFGSSLTTSRLLPALFSLLSLPLMYGLGLQLFGSRQVASLATALLAVSPFDVLFAQTARQYSLLTVMVLGSSFFLLLAVRSQTWRSWGLYTFSATLGLYIHPFFGLTLMAQGVYVLLLTDFTLKFPEENQVLLLNNSLSKFCLTVGGALVLYSPWLFVLITNYQRLSITTDWTKVSPGLDYLLKLWILSFTCPFLDLDFGFNTIWTYLLRLLVIFLIGVALYTLCRQTQRSSWLFILTSIFVPFLLLVLPDLVLGGKRSATTRYLISCFPGLQLAVAYLLTTKLQQEKRFWRGIVAMLLTGSIVSCTVSALSESWWNKDLSYANAAIAQRINVASLSLVVTDMGDDYTNTGDLISLSYRLHDNVQLLLLSQPPQFEQLRSNVELFVFRPSVKLRQALEQKFHRKLKPIEPTDEYSGQLWQPIKR